MPASCPSRSSPPAPNAAPKPRRSNGLIGPLASRPHVEVGAEHRLAENRQFRRAHRQADGEASDDGDFQAPCQPRAKTPLRDREFAASVMASPRNSPEIRPRRKTRMRSAFIRSSGTSEEIKTIATPSLAIPRRIP